MRFKFKGFLKNHHRMSLLYKSKLLFKTKHLFVLILFALSTNIALAQTFAPQEKVDKKKPSFTIGIKGGYDLPLFKMPYKELTYKGGLYWGAHADYRFVSNIGVRLDYANIRTSPNIEIPNTIYDGSTPIPTPFTTTNSALVLKRNFIGLGPSYTFSLGSTIAISIAPMAGYSWLDGGDAMSNSFFGYQLLNTGFKDNVFSTKGDLDVIFSLTKNLKISLGAYYLRHFGVHFDHSLDLNNIGTISILHGENVYDHTINPYTISSNPPNVIVPDPHGNDCKDLSSVGFTLGLNYTFGKSKENKTIPEKVIPEGVSSECNTCCPNDQHKVVVTVRDEISNKVIPNADVAVKDMQGNIIATGTSNSFGAVDFELPHENYYVTGNVYDVKTTTASIMTEEFTPNAIIQKEVLYDDLRFILKGNTTNKNTQQAEPRVIVSLTNEQTSDVDQDNSDGEGKFVFRLDKNSSYEIVGTKENRLSDIEGASTVGLTRSTTLFVDLELGMDDFDCGYGTILDIKYEYDSHQLTPSAKFELDRIVRYMNDHNVSRIELSSHTDCRGRNSYNQKLSHNRAKSASSYLVSRGISRDRIVAQGYGEERLLNQCSDGVHCNESEHLINRRTEAKLICR